MARTLCINMTFNFLNFFFKLSIRLCILSGRLLSLSLAPPTIACWCEALSRLLFFLKLKLHERKQTTYGLQFDTIRCRRSRLLWIACRPSSTLQGHHLSLSLCRPTKQEKKEKQSQYAGKNEKQNGSAAYLVVCVDENEEGTLLPLPGLVGWEIETKR